MGTQLLPRSPSCSLNGNYDHEDNRPTKITKELFIQINQNPDVQGILQCNTVYPSWCDLELSLQCEALVMFFALQIHGHFREFCSQRSLVHSVSSSSHWSQVPWNFQSQWRANSNGILCVIFFQSLPSKWISHLIILSLLC